MYHKSLCIWIVCSLYATPTFSARILGIVPTPSYSHQIVFRSLWRELSLRGHQLTVITANPMNDESLTNLTEIDVHFSYKTWNRLDLMNSISKVSISEAVNLGAQLFRDITNEQLEHPPVQQLIQNETEHFDLIMIENSYRAMLAFSERFKCPYILIRSMEMAAWDHYILGNPTHPVLYPDINIPFVGTLTFSERLTSTLTVAYLAYFAFPMYDVIGDSLIKKHFGDDYPAVNDILKNVSLTFTNTNPVFQVRPLVPSIIPIGGGMHFGKPQLLPKDLQTTLDNAKQGFIYFSLGTNVKSEYISESTRTAIIQTLSNLPYLVLWRNDLKLSNKSENMVVAKWLPQQDVLRHPHIKLFITQGGLQSIQEAIYNHVPIVGLPFFGDQFGNVRRIEEKGAGVLVDHKHIDKESFKKTILEVIENPRYRSKAKELAQLVQDQPMTGLERAVWWTEYVLRHKGAKHLRSPAMDLPAYQYFLLDVIGFLVALILIVVCLVILLIKTILKTVGYVKLKVKTL